MIMINDDTKKTIILSVVLVVAIALIFVLLFVDIDIKFFKFNAISSLKAEHAELVEKQKTLAQKETEYKDAVSKVSKSQESFDSEKLKYDSISDETLRIIKEATTEENYNIEYMWIRLGNYASSNNLTIIMAEPGGTFEESVEEDKESSKGGNKTNTTTTTTNKTTTGSVNSENVAKENTSNVQNASTNNSNNTSNANNTNNNASDQTNANGENNSIGDTLFKIQVKGSYLDVSDFVFEVENDKSLRFKLDNISMDYVEGTTIKATFNVKNLIINK